MTKHNFVWFSYFGITLRDCSGLKVLIINKGDPIIWKAAKLN
jgi:hypothetical protein